jgi:hypothetical protein
MNELEEAIRNIEERIGVRTGFFDELAKEDDWSFVIKAHALLESACAEILALRTGTPQTLDIFSRTELSSKSTGKVAFLKAFDLLNDRERRFISAFSEIRNSLVHNIRNTSFNLQLYVTALDKNQRKIFVENFGYAYLAEGSDGKDYVCQPDKVISNAKESIWLGLKYVLSVISIQMDTIRLRQQITEFKQEIAGLVSVEKTT